MYVLDTKTDIQNMLDKLLDSMELGSKVLSFRLFGELSKKLTWKNGSIGSHSQNYYGFHFYDFEDGGKHYLYTFTNKRILEYLEDEDFGVLLTFLFVLDCRHKYLVENYAGVLKHQPIYSKYKDVIEYIISEVK